MGRFLLISFRKTILKYNYMSNKKPETCEYKYKIGNTIYCKIRVNDCSICSTSVSKCKYAVIIPSRNNRVYYSIRNGEIVRKDGSVF